MGAHNKDPWWYALIRSRLFEGGYVLVMRGLFKVRVHRMELMPRSRPVVFCCNHRSHYDLFFGLAAGHRVLGEMPVPVIWQGALEYPLLGRCFRAWRAVSIGRSSHTTACSMALRQMVLHLREGRSLIMACEGKRLDALGPFRRGAAWAALRTGALVVPCSLHGAESLFSKMPWPDKFWGNVEVRIHPPLDPRAFGSVDELTEAIRRAVASQIDYPLQENVGSSDGGRPSPSNTLPV